MAVGCAAIIAPSTDGTFGAKCDERPVGRFLVPISRSAAVLVRLCLKHSQEPVGGKA